LELEKERKVTILDEYDCTVMLDRLRISIDSPRDPSLVDIMSELHQSNGYVYFDGAYYYHSGLYHIDVCESGWYLDLFVSNDP
jgi:hypothetical protein